MKNRMVLPLCAFLSFLLCYPTFAQGTEEPTEQSEPTAITAKRLPSPPMSATLRTVSTPARTRLVMISKKTNDITDDAAWFARLGLQLPQYKFGQASPEDFGELPRGSSLEYQGLRLQRAFNTANAGMNRVIQVYGADASRGRYLVCADGLTGESYYALDFENYRSPAGVPADYSEQPVVFAYEDKQGILYVSNGINGYAKEARGKTGYITALEPKTGKLLWRSAPLTQNASTFEDIGDVLVCGYGFTDEPDYLYLLDKRTGRRVQTIHLKTGPSVILRKGDRVYVRCYDTDYVFAIKR